METVWQELIRAVPWGAVIIILRILDIRAQKDERTERGLNAAEKSQHDRENQITINKTYAEAINALAQAVETGSNTTADAIKDLKTTVIEKYDNLGVTKDLLDIAKKQLNKRDNIKTR